MSNERTHEEDQKAWVRAQVKQFLSGGYTPTTKGADKVKGMAEQTFDAETLKYSGREQGSPAYDLEIRQKVTKEMLAEWVDNIADHIYKNSGIEYSDGMTEVLSLTIGKLKNDPSCKKMVDQAKEGMLKSAHEQQYTEQGVRRGSAEHFAQGLDAIKRAKDLKGHKLTYGGSK